MLKYFISVTEDLLTASVLVSMLFAYIHTAFGKVEKRILIGGTLGGVIAAAIMSYLKNRTRLIDTAMWNLRIFIVCVAAFILLAVFMIPAVRKAVKKPCGILIAAFAAVIVLTLAVYVLPDVMAYPFNFDLSKSNVLSTDFLYRFIGWLLGLLLILLIILSVYRGAKALGGKALTAIMLTALGVNAFSQLAGIFRTMLTRRIIPSNAVLFKIAKISYNYGNVFVFIILGLALIIPITLWIKSFNVKEPYSNPAEHRRIKAKWRTIRRWATTMIVCFVIAALTITAIKTLSNKEIELSPPEEAELVGDTMYVPLERVSDGHLHRFIYTAPSGTEIRFIVIKKPNGQSYGVGLDACDICGETGYYERDGLVVCKLCDVVMNVNTIGFKGGCNPIVIDYSIENGYIIVPTRTLLEHEKEFK